MMQDRYTGDVGDFGKYGLLRALAGHDLRLGVVWYLNRIEELNGDGGLTGYLSDPRKTPLFSDCDPWLYQHMHELVSSRRQVSEVARRNILPRDTLFFEQALPFRFSQSPTNAKGWRNRREEWCQAALRSTLAADVVFLDPDNGLANRPMTSCSFRSSLKYVFYDELQLYMQRGQSIILYHHHTRCGTFAEQVAKILTCLGRLSPAQKPWALTYHRGQARAYLIVPNHKHRQLLENRCLTFLRSVWGQRGHFKAFDLLPGSNIR